MERVLTDAIPVIDLRPFREGGDAGKAAVAAAIDQACRDTGFVVLTGHGVATDLLDAMLDTWQQFFDLPEADKRAWVVDDATTTIGYQPFATGANSYSIGVPTPPDLVEAFSIARDDTAGAAFDDVRSWFAVNDWPIHPVQLREVSLAYDAALRGTTDTVLRAMALALELPEDWLVQRNERAVLTTRVLDYRRREGAPAPLPDQLRLGAHTDFGVLTLLLADAVPGLQVMRHGTWHDVVPPRGSLVCNVGDLLAMWTNDRWASTLHRVVPPPHDVEGPVRRRSVAHFVDGDPSVTIACIPSCRTEDEPARYPPVQAGAWLRAKIVGSRAGEVPDLPNGGLTSAGVR